MNLLEEHWGKLVSLCVGAWAVIRILEWFVKGTIAKYGNGAKTSTNFKNGFDKEDKRRLLEAGKNCFAIKEMLNTMHRITVQTDSDGSLLVYREPEWEMTMSRIIKLLEGMQKAQEKQNETLTKINGSLQKTAMIQDNTCKALNRIEEEVRK